MSLDPEVDRCAHWFPRLLRPAASSRGQHEITISAGLPQYCFDGLSPDAAYTATVFVQTPNLEGPGVSIRERTRKRPLPGPGLRVRRLPQMILSNASAAPRVSDPRSRHTFAFVLVVKPTPVPTLPPTPSPPPTIPPAWAGERPHRQRQNVSNSEPEKLFNSSSGCLIVPQSAEEPKPT